MKGYRWKPSVGFSHCQLNRHSVALREPNTQFAVAGLDMIYNGHLTGRCRYTVINVLVERTHQLMIEKAVVFLGNKNTERGKRCQLK